MNKTDFKVPAPLFRDPIYDAPTDPVIVWNNRESLWWMLYTQRRSGRNSVGVAHVHGTDIGIASSSDGIRWLYRGTVPNIEFEHGRNTFWAPEVIYAEGKYHIYVTYITGVPSDWNRQRFIVHYTADDLWEWKFDKVLKLSSDKVIDACVHKTDSGTYKMWYKDEKHGSHTWSAVSHDLYNWTVCGEEISQNAHEGPNVFEFGGERWMITDEWNGQGVYKSADFTHWERTGHILREGGIRRWDGTMGNHADVVVCGDRAYIFYFTHPFFSNGDRHDDGFVIGEQESRACIQAAELTTDGRTLFCDRNRDFTLELTREAELC